MNIDHLSVRTAQMTLVKRKETHDCRRKCALIKHNDIR